MKIRFSIYLLFTCLSCLAQESKLKVGFKINPEITRQFADNYPDYYGYSSEVVYKFNYLSTGYGVQCVENFNKWLGVETGLYIHHQRFSYRSRGIVTSFYGYDYTIEKTFGFIQIPVSLRLNVKDYFYASLGTSLNYQLETKRKVVDGDVSAITFFPDENDNTLAAGLIGTIGRDWKLDDHFSVISELRVDGIPSRAIGINFGLGVGANYSF